MPKRSEPLTLKNGKRLPLTRRKKRRIALFFLLIILVVLVDMYVSARMKPLVLDVADGIISDIVTKKVNESISAVLTDNNFSYENLVTLQKDADGNVTALIANMTNINRLQLEVIDQVIDRLGDLPDTTVKIPIGNLIGGAILSGRGPKISIQVISVTNVTTNYQNQFTSAGINQTLHQVILNVDVSLKLLVSGYSSTSVVSTQMSVAETVIVGKVPNYYANYREGAGIWTIPTSTPTT